MKKQALKTTQKLVLFGLVATCLTIFATVELKTKTNDQASQSETLSDKMATLRTPASLNKTCVLFYERAEHPSLAKLKKQYKNHPEFIIVPVAKPTDIVRCVMDHNPKEVLILAHSHKVNSRVTQLTYFYTLTGDETMQNYKKIVKDLKRQHKQLVSKRDFHFCNTHPKSRETCNYSQRKEMRLRSAITRLQALKRSDPTFNLIFGYKKALVGQKHFENLYSLASTSNLNLKRIRLFAGNPKRIAKSYGGLVKLSREQGVKVQKAPKNQMVALYGNRHFSSLDSNWPTQTNFGE